MTKSTLSLVAIAVAFACGGACRSAGALPASSVVQRDLIVGVATHYDWLATVFCLTCSPCEQVLVMRLEREPAGQCVKLVYTYLRPDDDLHTTILAHRSSWTVRAKRDPSCDEAMAARGDHLRAINGAEAESPISSDMLPCYRFGVGDYRATETVPK